MGKEKFNTKEVFDKYTENNELNTADIFHLYDTGEECFADNSGYHDSRHFRLIAFNTETMEKCDCGIHDGISSYSDDLTLSAVRVYADGSFFLRLKETVKLSLFQNVHLYKK